jgi:hypothetical protein
LSSMPTVASFAGETKAASRYEDHLGEAEEVAIRQVCCPPLQLLFYTLRNPFFSHIHYFLSPFCISEQEAWTWYGIPLGLLLWYDGHRLLVGWTFSHSIT